MPESSPSELHGTDLALPVMGWERKDRGSNRPREMCTHPLQGLGIMQRPDTGVFEFHVVTDGEYFPEYDLAVIKAGISFGQTFRWCTARIAILDRVRAFGYPHGFDPDSEWLHIRGFEGEIVGGGLGRPVNMSDVLAKVLQRVHMRLPERMKRNKTVSGSPRSPCMEE